MNPWSSEKYLASGINKSKNQLKHDNSGMFVKSYPLFGDPSSLPPSLLLILIPLLPNHHLVLIIS